jgi:hypothetical protein
MSTYNIPQRLNREGLTFAEWLAAAGVRGDYLVAVDLALALHDAWRAGEDPTDWRAAQGKVSP